jgi:MOSC domain-containing protein YiiM
MDEYHFRRDTHNVAFASNACAKIGLAVAATLISVQVGLPRTVLQGNEEVSTGIFKSPVESRLRMRSLNLDGDRQADLSVHGGPNKAVYAYPSENYPYWKNELPGVELPWGAFGENLTTSGLTESDVCIGDRFSIGGAEVVVTQPRLPCFKLNLKFGRDDMVKRFLASRRTGFYLRVLKEGEVGAGDDIVRVHHNEQQVSVVETLLLHLGESKSSELRQRVLQVEYLSPSWRKEISEQV